MKLPSQHREHVHPRQRLALQQHGNVVPIHLDTHRFFNGRRLRLMRRLLQHRRESKKFPVRRLVDHHFLMILVHGRHPHPSRHDDIRLPA